jgi:hypothetical protein
VLVSVKFSCVGLLVQCASSTRIFMLLCSCADLRAGKRAVRSETALRLVAPDRESTTRYFLPPIYKFLGVQPPARELIIPAIHLSPRLGEMSSRASSLLIICVAKDSNIPAMRAGYVEFLTAPGGACTTLAAMHQDRRRKFASLWRNASRQL